MDELLLVAHWFRIRPGEVTHTFRREAWEMLPLAGDVDSEVAIIKPRRGARMVANQPLA